MVDLVKKGYSPKNVGQDADYIALKNSKNAMNWQGIWQVNDVTTLKNAKIGLAPLPKIGPQGGVWGNSHQFVLPRNGSNDAEQAGRGPLLHPLVHPNEAEWAQSAKVPAETSLQTSADVPASSPTSSRSPQEVPDVHFPPAVAGIGDATAKLYDAIQSAVLGKSDPARALQQLGQAGHRHPQLATRRSTAER